MTAYYVGSGGNDASDGTSWENRRVTLNAAEDLLSAGDTLYVGPGVYRELWTLDKSGSAGSPITAIGDYTGANTDGTGGVVRITGSDDDRAESRANCIIATAARTYRTFRGFVFDGMTADAILANTANCHVWTIEDCALFPTGANAIKINGASTGWTIQDCYCVTGGSTSGALVYFLGNSDSGNLVQNCVVFGGAGRGVTCDQTYNVTIRNCLFNCGLYAITVVSIGANTVAVNNCIIANCNVGFVGGALGMIIEDYNCVYRCVTARSNTATGAHSVAYPPLHDTRWFFEMVGGGSMLSPFDLASYSQLINVAGTSPTASDMRGTTVQGAEREWGALEYDSTLDIEAGSGGGGRPAFGDRTGGKF